MSRVYTFRCPHCGHPDCNVWTRDGTRWYFCPHAHPRPVWNGSAWITCDCAASNCHVPRMFAKHMRNVYRDGTRREQAWYHGRLRGRDFVAAVRDRRG